MVVLLALTTDGKIWTTNRAFEASLIDNTSDLDLAMICACKHLVSNYILSHQDELFNGLSLATSINAFQGSDL
jgi:hypothetical protein